MFPAKCQKPACRNIEVKADRMEGCAETNPRVANQDSGGPSVYSPTRIIPLRKMR